MDIFYLSKPAANYLKESVDTVIKIHENFPHGDVLVFLTGQEEVEEVVDQLFNYARSLKGKLSAVLSLVLQQFLLVYFFR